jgi:phosphatidylserine decarboxylase
MRMHKEGTATLLIVFIVVLIVNFLTLKLTHSLLIILPVLAASIILYIFIRYFFRIPENRKPVLDAKGLISPCDGEVVVIEDVFEDDILKCSCKKVSIFMSPLNVHINWFPVNGKILHATHSNGSHLAAWAPKSSIINERSTVLIETEEHKKILVRQIAGAMARRVVCYAKEGEYAKQNEELGFIKFGSRVDLYIPFDYEIVVNLEQKVTGSQTIIATLK